MLRLDGLVTRAGYPHPLLTPLLLEGPAALLIHPAPQMRELTVASDADPPAGHLGAVGGGRGESWGGDRVGDHGEHGTEGAAGEFSQRRRPGAAVRWSRVSWRG
jgi:hypothetical protein